MNITADDKRLYGTPELEIIPHSFLLPARGDGYEGSEEPPVEQDDPSQDEDL